MRRDTAGLIGGGNSFSIFVELRGVYKDPPPGLPMSHVKKETFSFQAFL